MTKPDIIQEKPIVLAELKEHLEKLKKATPELNFRAERTLEYVEQFTVLSMKKATALKENIEKLQVPRLREEHIVKIVDILPTTQEEAKALLSGYTLTVTNENLKKIADLVKEAL